jgi:peptide/nickel transport system substrate-binding protein
MFRSIRPAAAGVGFLLIAAWPVEFSGQPFPPPLPAVRREVRIGVSGVPPLLDPAIALTGTVPLVSRQVFDTLVAYREHSTDIEPALATRWTVSRDGLAWSFTLREGVRFHDGSPLAAADVVASFTRHLRAEPSSGVPPPGVPPPAWGSLLRGVPGVIRTVQAIDARTVRFTLVQPYAPLLTVLAHPALGVVKTVSTPDGTARLVGTGPYRLVDAAPGLLTLEAAPAHWQRRPRSERLLFIEVSGDEQAEAGLDAGTLDVWLCPGPPRRPTGALSTTGLDVGYLAFQTEKEPFASKKIREAIAAAVDPGALGAALAGAAVPLQSYLPPGVWGRWEGFPVLGGHRDAVKTLLGEGGWTADTVPTLLVAEEAGPIDIRAVAQALRTMLATAGITVTVRAEPGSKVRAALQAGEHELVLAEARVSGGDPHLLLFPLSTGEGASKGPRPLSLSFYRNPRLDDVLVRASQLAFRVERARLYQRAQAMLADDLPWLPLYVRLIWVVVRPDVRGLRLHPTGFHRLDPVTVEAPAVPVPQETGGESRLPFP